MKARFGIAALDAIKKNYDIFLERLKCCLARISVGAMKATCRPEFIVFLLSVVNS